MTKKTKQVSISVDKEVWDDFVNKIESVEGKTYGKIGPTLTNLIRKYYLSSSDDSGDNNKITKLEKELSDNYKRIDNLLIQKEELKKENSQYSKKVQELDDKIEGLNNQIIKLTDDYETTLKDNEKYDELLNDLEDKVLKLSEENQRLIESLNIKSEENNEIYITAIKNEEKYINQIYKYKNQIKRLTKNNKILIKRFKYTKKSNNTSNKSRSHKNTDESTDTDTIKAQQLQKQYNEYMKQFENIKRK